MQTTLSFPQRKVAVPREAVKPSTSHVAPHGKPAAAAATAGPAEDVVDLVDDADVATHGFVRPEALWKTVGYHARGEAAISPALQRAVAWIQV